MLANIIDVLMYIFLGFVILCGIEAVVVLMLALRFMYKGDDMVQNFQKSEPEDEEQAEYLKKYKERKEGKRDVGIIRGRIQQRTVFESSYDQKTGHEKQGDGNLPEGDPEGELFPGQDQESH
jgi:hypothetical protein